jgi:hypothetical protein
LGGVQIVPHIQSIIGLEAIADFVKPQHFVQFFGQEGVILLSVFGRFAGRIP